MSNETAAVTWDGDKGDQWVRLQERYDRMLKPWADLLAETTATQPGEHVLDIGCGCGATTLDAARAAGADGSATGVDISEAMLAHARTLATAAGLPAVSFTKGDAQSDPLGGLYDVVISRFGVMFFDDPIAAFTNIAAHVQPGGRLAMIAWAPLDDQDWLMIPGAAALAHVAFPDLGPSGAPGMFALSDPTRVTELLHTAGWTDVAFTPERRPMLLAGGGLEEAMTFLQATGPGAALLKDADPDAAALAVEAIRAVFLDHLSPEGVVLDAAVHAITARRRVA